MASGGRYAISVNPEVLGSAQSWPSHRLVIVNRSAVSLGGDQLSGFAQTEEVPGMGDFHCLKPRASLASGISRWPQVSALGLWRGADYSQVGQEFLWGLLLITWYPGHIIPCFICKWG